MGLFQDLACRGRDHADAREAARPRTPSSSSATTTRSDFSITPGTTTKSIRVTPTFAGSVRANGGPSRARPRRRRSPRTSLSLKFFGAVATLEELRSLLEVGPSARTVNSSVETRWGRILEACLSIDEPAALVVARDATAPGKDPQLYGAAKQALNGRSRRFTSPRCRQGRTPETRSPARAAATR